MWRLLLFSGAGKQETLHFSAVLFYLRRKPMVLPFYMLLRTKKGQAFLTVQEAQKIAGVKIVHSVMGSYDVILYAEANDLSDIRRIRETVHKISAVVRTETAVHT